MLVLTNIYIKPSGRILGTLPRFCPQINYMVAAVGSEKDKHNYTTDSKRHSLQAVELSQRIQTAVYKNPAPAMGARFTVFSASRPCGPDGWLALLLMKAGDVETNPGPTNTHKQVWICDV